jgi:hypothetical protein
MKSKFLPMAILLLLYGCSTLGLPTPTTFNQKIAVGYSSVTTVLQTTTTLLQGAVITAADAQNIEAQADNVKAALDIAQQIEATDATTANNKLTAALTALQALQAYLNTKGNKP